MKLLLREIPQHAAESNVSDPTMEDTVAETEQEKVHPNFIGNRSVEGTQ